MPHKMKKDEIITTQPTPVENRDNKSLMNGKIICVLPNWKFSILILLKAAICLRTKNFNSRKMAHRR